MFAFTVSLVAGLVANSVNAAPYDWTEVNQHPITRKDVVVIGGGSSGTYAAIKLHRMGKDVAVVEKHAHFGGHTSTYHVPGGNITIDFGVQGYLDEQIIRDHFARFDIPLEYETLTQTSFGIPHYMDFRNGQMLPNFNYSFDLSGFLAQWMKYPYLHYNTALPDPVPEDLLLPFGEFLAKYNLQEETYSLFYNIEGLGDTLHQTTLYVMRYFHREYLQGLSSGHPGALVTQRRYNQELYDKAQEELGEDAWVDSYVLAARRDEVGVWLAVQTPTGIRVIVAEKLIVSIPPLTTNMEPFAIDQAERSLFQKFSDSGWYVGLVQADGFPPEFDYQNTRTYILHHFPQLPALYQISPTRLPDIHLVRYGSMKGMSDEAVQQDILKTVERVRHTVVGSNQTYVKPAELIAYASHNPFNLNVPPEDIAEGFYTKLGKLQGHRSTWYTGAAFMSHTTGALWNFTDHLVDRMYE